MSDVPITAEIIKDFRDYFDLDENLKGFASLTDVTRGLTFGFAKTQRIGTFTIIPGNLRREATYNWVAHWFYINLYPYIQNPTHNGRAIRLTQSETRSVGSESISEMFEAGRGKAVSLEDYQITIYGRRYLQIVSDLFESPLNV